MSIAELFAASNGLHGKGLANDLQAIKRRALATFSRHEVADLFANSGKADQDLLNMYYDMSALPLKQRKASFRNASSNDKSDLWRTHLALFFVKRPELNERQQEVLLTAMALATPEHFEVRPTSPDWKTKVREPLRALEGQIPAAFSFEDGAKIFATLGDDAEAAKRSPALGWSLINSVDYQQVNNSSQYKQRTPNRFAGQDMYVERNSCSCSTYSDWCPISGYCSENGSCTPTQSGCGTLWRNPCNGGCQ